MTHTQQVQKSMLMGAAELAGIAGISVRTITRLAGEGKIPGAVRIGKAWRFNRARIAEFIGADEGACSDE